MSLEAEMIPSMSAGTHTETEPATSLVSPPPPAAASATQLPEKPPPPPRVYDLYSWEVKAPQTRLVYIRDSHTVDQEMARFKPGPCGFDLEWKPCYRKGQKENPVALVQLANEETVLLIHITAIRPSQTVFPPSLLQVLWDPAYIKCGVGIQGDCKKLWNDYQVNTRNCVDLALLARTVDNARWKGKYSQPIGLARLCETYEELSLTKGKITRSNWEAVLSEAQVQYAANDCHSGLTIFKRLFPMTLTMNPLPLPSFYSFDLYKGLTYVPSIDDPHTLWRPYNPFYDAGPPPEPKPPKEKKDPKGKQASQGENGAASAGGSGNAAEGSTSNSAPRRARYPQMRSAEGQASPRGRHYQAHEQQSQRGRGLPQGGYRPRSHQQHNAGQRSRSPTAVPAAAQPNGDNQNRNQYPDTGPHRPFRGRGRGRSHGGFRGGGPQ